MTTTLILIRHGETDWNLNKRYCGFRDVGLNRKGRAQARLLKKRLAADKVKIEKIYVSDRRRAIETARVLFGRKRLKIVRGLKEMNFGALEGLTHDEAMDNHGTAYTRWIKDPFRYHVPRGEKLNSFRKRASGAFKDIIRKSRGKSVAVVCHGGTISAFLTYIYKSKDFWRTIPGSTSLSIVEFKKGKPALRIMNCTKHLKNGK
jgi:broad specificity phosphatase PhoE